MTSDSVGQSGGEEAKWKMELKGVKGNNLTECTKVNRVIRVRVKFRVRVRA